MKFKITRNDLLQALGLAQSIAERKGTMPILANVLISAKEKGEVTCKATDLQSTFTSYLQAEVVVAGVLSVSAKGLFEIVKNLSCEDVSIASTDGNHAQVEGGRSRFRLVGLSGDDFPQTPEPPEVGYATVSAESLSTLIARTLYSVSLDQTRQHLTGVRVESEGDTIRMVSTDGHRLSKAEEVVPGGWPLDTPILVPRKGIAELKKMLDGSEQGCSLMVSDGVLFARVGNSALSIRLLDSEFPPYEKVIPATTEKRVVVDRVQLIEALKRVALMAEDRTNGVRMKLEADRLVIESDNPELGEAREEIEVDYDGPGLTIGFNAAYLLDALARVDGDEAFVELNEELDPCVVRPVDSENFLGVVMPLRL